MELFAVPGSPEVAGVGVLVLEHPMTNAAATGIRASSSVVAFMALLWSELSLG